MRKLVDLISHNQTYLVKRVIDYAKRHGYTKYTSTLEEAWVASISGLSEALTEEIRHRTDVPEIEVDRAWSGDRVTSFGVIEAQRHRHRGISLELFLSLFKYYRQAFLDLIDEQAGEDAQRATYALWVNRFFDINEIAYISEWTAHTNDTLLDELREANRNLTNEKNKYVTLFESAPNATAFLDSEHRCINMNYAAQQLFSEQTHAPGSAYYSDTLQDRTIFEKCPWLSEDYTSFCARNVVDDHVEKEFDSPLKGKRILDVRFHMMLDVSGKFDGTVIVFDDLTDYKAIESKLRKMSFHDQLTGLYNRTYLEEEVSRLIGGNHNPVSFVSIDIDGMKRVNDNFGHATGDRLLVNVSQLLTASFRQRDVVVRMGGDEFGVLLASSDEKDVHSACRRLHANIARFNEEAQIPISLSVGAATGHIYTSGDMHELMRRADIEMYADKESQHKNIEKLFGSKAGM